MNPLNLRKSTLANSAEIREKPFHPPNRKILPLGETPSLKATSGEKFDPEVSRIKANMRISEYFVLALFETKLGITFERSKTSLQGTQATDGCHADHACFHPSTIDNYTKDRIDYINRNGVTPTKTRSFLEFRCGCNEEELQWLDDNHEDLELVKAFIESKLPPNGLHSLLENSRFHWNCNATFENPYQTNQYDSKLERTIDSFLKELQQKRANKEINAQESTEELVAWLRDYYKKSISNLANQIDQLGDLSNISKDMRKFEKANFEKTELDEKEFEKYLQDVDSFLKNYNALCEKQLGCPSFEDKLQFSRNDFKFLNALAKNRSAKYFTDNSFHLRSQPDFDVTMYQEKCRLFQQEAKAQKKGIKTYKEACSIVKLVKMLFGDNVDGVREAPQSPELTKKLFELTQAATPVKLKMEKRRRPLGNITNSNNQTANPNFKRTLFENEHDPEDLKKRKIDTFT